MTLAPGAVRWAVLALALAGLTVLYGDALRTGFLNDDYLFLEEARHLPLAESLGSLGPLGNYFRPVSRQLYFEFVGELAGGDPLLFHLFNYGVFLASLVLLADLLRAFLPLPGVLAGTLFFALLPFQRVNLMWTSSVQDLLALAGTLAAVALFRRGRDAPAALAYLLAVFSKESALPLPAALFVWATWVDRSPVRAAARRLIPFTAVALAWAGAVLLVRARHPEAAALPRPEPDHFLAAYVHGLQSFLGLDHPAGLWAGLSGHGPAPLPLALLAGLALLLSGKRVAAGPRPAPNVMGFGAVWLLAFGVVLAPVAPTWSSYHYTLAAVAAALWVGRSLSRVGPLGWLALVAGLLWWHAGATSSRAFAVTDRAWGWTSHLTPFYFQRAANLTDTLMAQLRRLEPSPETGTRFFFATLPPWAGFQMGNGALLRERYEDPSLASFFYSQFSESTAADRPCRFLYWDGQGLARLYGPGDDVFFQVGSDLLVFGRTAGARHAFQRGLQAGESPLDHLYWLGWSEIWLGRRQGAEDAWKAMGARDDSLEWRWQMRLARRELIERNDTLATRRHLAEAIRHGIGRPEAHAVLGQLLLPDHSKYGLLELKVAAFLNPRDWVARRDLAAGLAAQRLDDLARVELEGLRGIHPEWPSDSLLQKTLRTLAERARAGSPVVEF